MRWAQITFLVIQFLSLLMTANLHGKPKEGNNNFWITVIGVLIMIPLIWAMGGFRGLFYTPF